MCHGKFGSGFSSLNLQEKILIRSPSGPSLLVWGSAEVIRVVPHLTFGKEQFFKNGKEAAPWRDVGHLSVAFYE